jgi:hypothetical protein
VLQAVAQLPVPVRATVRCGDPFDTVDVPDVPVIDTEPIEISVVQISPRYDRSDDEQLCPEMQPAPLKVWTATIIASRALISC